MGSTSVAMWRMMMERVHMRWYVLLPLGTGAVKVSCALVPRSSCESGAEHNQVDIVAEDKRCGEESGRRSGIGERVSVPGRALY